MVRASPTGEICDHRDNNYKSTSSSSSNIGYIYIIDIKFNN